MANQITPDQASAAQEVLQQIQDFVQAPQDAHTKEHDVNFKALVEKLSPTDKEFLARHATAVWTEERDSTKRREDEAYRDKVAHMNRFDFEMEKNKLK